MKVTRWIDGDTFEGELTISCRVRIKDCWAPEKRGPEKVKGKEALEKMKEICPEGSTVRVFVPTTGKIATSLSFGRWVGTVWKGDENICDELIKQGLATRTKGEKQWVGVVELE